MAGAWRGCCFPSLPSPELERPGVPLLCPDRPAVRWRRVGRTGSPRRGRRWRGLALQCSLCPYHPPLLQFEPLAQGAETLYSQILARSGKLGGLWGCWKPRKRGESICLHLGVSDPAVNWTVALTSVSEIWRGGAGGRERVCVCACVCSSVRQRCRGRIPLPGGNAGPRHPSSPAARSCTQQLSAADSSPAPAARPHPTPPRRVRWWLSSGRKVLTEIQSLPGRMGQVSKIQRNAPRPAVGTSGRGRLRRVRA